ncbi:uncharacterized protein PAN0_020c5888 [Moesziomyces antarcticus]|uniref:Uncharacterized protein n=1 Tax=Pseudozyma antarctica TaxID=84753 RepID=A0A081CLW3_PSEA2|nr:uncharacterized protein PAN0_020c5888 [Moesziomyces antarcticus]GAK67659.1 conserved hypothetical protein [Moesziomyces antarcticus]
MIRPPLSRRFHNLRRTSALLAAFYRLPFWDQEEVTSGKKKKQHGTAAACGSTLHVLVVVEPNLSPPSPPSIFFASTHRLPPLYAEQDLDEASHTMAETAGEAHGLLHNLLSEVVPYPVFQVLAGFSNLIYRLLGSSNDPSSWTSTLLPPLITFFLAYFALVTAYRTVRSMISLAWFGIKWGAIIGALIAIWAWWTDNTDAINSTGTVPGRGGFLNQRKHRSTSLPARVRFLNTFGPLFNSLYSQLPSSSAAGTSSANSRRRTTSQTRRRTRGSRNDQRAFSFDPTADLPADLGAGFGAFADLFGRPDGGADRNGVDFGALLRTLVTEGQRQGIDALSALRAAGKVQDELKRFQQDPARWFEGVGDSFRTQPQAPNTRARAQARRAQRQTELAGMEGDSWWSNLAAGVNEYLKPEPRGRTGRAARNAQ